MAIGYNIKSLFTVYAIQNLLYKNLEENFM